jgi:1-acyl-sn-glycerol-3-phosphate acyltransferase
MIKASHKNWARLFFSVYITHILKNSFSHFFIVNDLPELPKDKAVLITPNHISWWDGFFIDYLNRVYFKRRAYVMILEEQLKKYYFLKKIGGFSINPVSKKDLKESLNYATELLLNKENLVIIFPEGELRPFDTKENPIKKGVLSLSKNIANPFAVLIIAIKISFYNERSPEIYISFGPVMDSDKLKNNFIEYKQSFFESITAVHNASINRIYLKDLFQ